MCNGSKEMQGVLFYFPCLFVPHFSLSAGRLWNIPTLPKTASLSSSMSVVTAKEESKNLKSSSVIGLKSVNIFLGAWILKPCVQDYEVKGIRQVYVLLERVGEEICLAGLRWGFHCVGYNMPELSHPCFRYLWGQDRCEKTKKDNRRLVWSPSMTVFPFSPFCSCRPSSCDPRSQFTWTLFP